jgi:uncharacterized protein YegP (UPF0339 family)
VAGHFEIVTDQDGNALVRLVDKRGQELALSLPFASTGAAIDGIKSFREVAASAPIRDHTSSTYRRLAEQHEKAVPHQERRAPVGKSRRLREHRRH